MLTLLDVDFLSMLSIKLFITIMWMSNAKCRMYLGRQPNLTFNT